MSFSRRSLLLGAAGAGASGLAHGQARPTLSVGAAPAAFRELYEEIGRELAKREGAPPVELRLFNTYPDLTQQILRDTMVGQTFDVSHQALNQLRIMVNRGLATPLDEMLRNEGGAAAQGLSPTVTGMGTIDGRLYGMPFWASVPAVFFNADLIRRAGGNPAAFPRTWSEIIALGRRIKALSDGMQGAYLIYANTDWNFQALVLSFGGAILSPDEREIAFDSPAGLEALRVLRAFGEAGQIDMTHVQARQAFAAGQLGIIVDASSILPRFEEQAVGRFAVGLAPHPIPAESGRLPAGGNATVILARTAERRRAAWDYVRFASGAIGQTIMVRRTGAMPVSNAAIQDEGLLGRFYAERPNQRALLASLPSMTRWFEYPGDNSNRIVKLVEEQLRDVITLRRTPEEVLASLSRDAKALMPR